MSKSDLESKFEWQLFSLGYKPWSEDNPDGYRREYLFHPQRKFRFDFAFVREKVAVEVEGGLNSPRSAHRSFYGTRRDIFKGNQAIMLGWTVLRLSDVEIKNGSGSRMLEDLLAKREGK